MKANELQTDLLLKKIVIRLKAMERIAEETGLFTQDRLREEMLRVQIDHDQIEAELDLSFRQRLLDSAIATAASCQCADGCLEFLYRIFLGDKIDDEKSIEKLNEILPEITAIEEGEWHEADRSLWAGCWMAGEMDTIDEMSAEKVTVCKQSLLSAPYPELNGTKSAIMHALELGEYGPDCACASCRKLAPFSVLDKDHEDRPPEAFRIDLPQLSDLGGWSEEEMESELDLEQDLRDLMATDVYFSTDLDAESKQEIAEEGIDPSAAVTSYNTLDPVVRDNYEGLDVWLETLFYYQRSYLLASGWAFGAKKIAARRLAEHVASHPHYVRRSHR